MPDVFLRRRWEQGELPVVDADNGENPGTRAADRADVYASLEEHPRIKLIAAVALGLQGAEEPGLLELFKRFIGQSPQVLYMRHTLAQGGE